MLKLFNSKISKFSAKLLTTPYSQNCASRYPKKFSSLIQRMASGESKMSDVRLRVLEKVEGFGERRNTLVLGPRESGGGSSVTAAETVLFFPGDVQNFENILKHHEANKKWKEWTFENTVISLQKRFPNAQIVLVTPSRRVDETFSCYDNFMETDVLGSPVSTEPHQAWEHLKLLLENARKRIHEGQDTDERVIAEDSCLIMVGFSKGCTVLNQLMYELQDACSNETLLSFVRRIQAFYWLDGGHAGTIPTYVIDDDIMRQVANLKATFYVHVTPYQVQDEGRPHIGEEYTLFISKLMHYGADVKSIHHFRGESKSLRKHFEVLKLF